MYEAPWPSARCAHSRDEVPISFGRGAENSAHRSVSKDGVEPIVAHPITDRETSCVHRVPPKRYVLILGFRG